MHHTSASININNSIEKHDLSILTVMLVPNSTNCWVSVSKQQGARSILSQSVASGTRRRKSENQEKSGNERNRNGNNCHGGTHPERVGKSRQNPEKSEMRGT